MKIANEPNQSKTDDPGSEQVFRQLVESVRDYAIIMLDPGRLCRKLEHGGRAHQGLSIRRDHRTTLS